MKEELGDLLFQSVLH
ncbi:MAG: hypothetical protein F6K35_14865, partial [Okeania sp. SIO2H7]|nr:hypothetical protein [Okeania sp. SIO2H7]